MLWVYIVSCFQLPSKYSTPFCLFVAFWSLVFSRCRQWQRSSPPRTGLSVLTAFNSATTDTSYNPLPLRYPTDHIDFRLYLEHSMWKIAIADLGTWVRSSSKMSALSPSVLWVSSTKFLKLGDWNTFSGNLSWRCSCFGTYVCATVSKALSGYKRAQ